MSKHVKERLFTYSATCDVSERRDASVWGGVGGGNQCLPGIPPFENPRLVLPQIVLYLESASGRFDPLICLRYLLWFHVLNK